MAPYPSLRWHETFFEVFAPQLKTDTFFYPQIQLKLCETPGCRILRQTPQTLPHCFWGSWPQGTWSRNNAGPWGRAGVLGLVLTARSTAGRAHVLALTHGVTHITPVTSAPLCSWNICLTLPGRKMSSLESRTKFTFSVFPIGWVQGCILKCY